MFFLVAVPFVVVIVCGCPLHTFTLRDLRSQSFTVVVTFSAAFVFVVAADAAAQ